MTLVRITGSLLVAALIGACGGGAQPPGSDAGDATEESAAPVEEVVTEEGAPVEVAVGTTFAIQVEANASVGYVWEVTEPGDPTIVEHNGFFYVDDGGEQAAGAGGLVDYRFTAVGPGTTTVVLLRTFQDKVEDPPVERRHEITVTE